MRKFAIAILALAFASQAQARTFHTPVRTFLHNLAAKRHQRHATVALVVPAKVVTKTVTTTKQASFVVAPRTPVRTAVKSACPNGRCPVQ